MPQYPDVRSLIMQKMRQPVASQEGPSPLRQAIAEQQKAMDPVSRAMRLLGQGALGFGDVVAGALGLPTGAEKEPGKTPYNFGAMLGAAAPLAAGAMTVFHGSPHVFNKFDMSKVGMGEGGAAYGRGLYFAENPEVAQSYRTAGNPTILPDGRLLKEKSAIYHVDLPDDAVAKMLDWDTPLSQQPEAVRKAMAEMGANDPTATAGNLFQALRRNGDPELTLKAHGVPGIKYFDRNSRAAGQGSRNYVVFDDQLPTILKQER